MNTNHFLTTIRPLVKFSQIFGVCTFSFRQRGFKTSKIRCIYTLLIFATIFMMILCSIINVCQEIFTEKSRFIMGGHLFASSVYILAMLTNIIISQREHIRLILQMNYDEKEFKGLNKYSGTVYYNGTKLLAKVNLFFSLFLILLMIIRITILYKGDIKIIFFSIAQYIPIVLGTILNSHIITYINIIKERASCLINYINWLNSDSVEYIMVVRRIAPTTELIILKKICMLHHRLCKEIRQISEIFGYVFLAWFGLTLKNIVIYVYLINHSEILSANVAPTYVPGVVMFIQTVIICHVCDVTIKKVMRMSQLIHNIKSDIPHLRDEIEMFLLQIANERVEFSAAGFFPINYELIFSMVGSGLTYIIILKQL